MTWNSTILAIALALVGSTAARGAGEPPALRAKLDDIDRRAAAVSDLSGRFRQEKYTALLKKPLVSSGRVRTKGAVVRWDTETPEPAVLHSDGKEIRMYYPKQAVVEVYPIDRRLVELAASPLPRLAALRQHFSIGQLPRDQQPEAEREDPNRLALRLVPTDEFLGNHVEEVRVVLDVAAAGVVRVEVDDADGDRTVILFLEATTNTGIKPSDLELVLPAGTKVSRPLEGAAK